MRPTESQERASEEITVRPDADLYAQMAGDRVLLYLRCLGFPAQQALDLALRALKAAELDRISSSGDSPVAEAMRALRRILLEQTAGESGIACYKTEECELPVLHSTSPIRRLHMTPEEVTPIGLRLLLAKLLKGRRS